MRLASLALLVGACTTTLTTTPSSLADLHGATLLIQGWNNPRNAFGPTGVNVDLFSFPEDPPCATLGDDVTVTLDGAALVVENRGAIETDEGGSFCVEPQFHLDTPPTAEHSELVLHDATDEWRIGVTDLFANDFAVVRTDPAIEIVWPSAPQPFRAHTAIGSCVTDTLEVWGTMIEDQVCRPLGRIEVEGDGDRQADYCDGPAHCTVQVSSGADLQL